MHYTIERLMNGDDDVTGQFVAAKDRWENILSNLETDSVDALAKRISVEQSWFEANCGGRWEGQEVMAWSAFGSLYKTALGFDENATVVSKLAEAFEKSMCSIEVKGHARNAAKSYRFED